IAYRLIKKRRFPAKAGTHRLATRAAEDWVPALPGSGISAGIGRGCTPLGLASGSVTKALDPAADLVGAGLQRRAVNDEAGADIGDVLDLDEAVGLERRAGLHEVDDVAAEAEAGPELDRAVQFDALGLDAARGEMPAGDLWVFGGDAQVAPAARVAV